ncbi:MAG: hypothetical protein HOY79_27285 [Streptomyces sp.]|nr:hypothetical protein [Streptomyces sp.]
MSGEKIIDKAKELCRTRRNKLCSNQFESICAPGPERIGHSCVADRNGWGRM